MKTSRRKFLKLVGAVCVAGKISADCNAAPPFSAKEAEYYEKLADNMTHCLLCPNGCRRSPGERGRCRARENVKGTYISRVYSLPCVLAIDPIEKCPLYHFHIPGPGFSIATAGCNLGCHYCQNWQFSQKTPEETKNFDLSPADVVKKAKEYKVGAIAFFYTEPTIYIEYMKDIAREAKKAGVPCVMVTGGFINKKPLEDLFPLIDAFVVGLKGFEDKFYQDIVQGKVAPVLETLKTIHAAKRHLEIVTLLVPTLNDKSEFIRQEISWIGENLGKEVPLHFTRFIPQYRLKGLPPTPVSTLEKARDEALKQGLHYVYTGNVSGHEGNHTYCPKCKRILIERLGFKVLKEYHKKGKCSACEYTISGTW